MVKYKFDRTTVSVGNQNCDGACKFDPMKSIRGSKIGTNIL